MAIIDASGFSRNLNIIGVVSLFGGEIALSALRYTVLVRDTWTSIYFSMIVPAGLQTIALKMFKRMHDRISVAISPGIRDDLKIVVGLAASGRYKYCGIHSGTKMSVESVLGESVLRRSHSKEINVDCTRQGENPKRDIKLKVIRLNTLEKVGGKRIRADAAPFGIVYLMPLVTLTGIVMTILIGDYFALTIVVVNVLCNMLIVYSTRATGIKYPEGNASSGVPFGHIFVEGPSGTYLVLGHEDAIQYLFQKPLVVPPTSNDAWQHLQRFVACLSYITVIANIITTPFATLFGQLIFGILMLCGLLQNILLAINDGDKLLYSIAVKASSVEYVDEYIFQPRSSMIAFCALVAGLPNDSFLKNSLPNTGIYTAWFQSVMECVAGGDSPAYIEKEDVVLLDNLNADLRDAVREYREFKQRHEEMTDV
jgi:hypothetical protein